MEKKISYLTIMLYVLAGALSVIGLLIIAFFLVKLGKEYSIYGESPIEMEKTGQVGDFIGGLVGTIWSFAGVILFFLTLDLQRKEFRLQRKELSSHRNEFLVNRISNLVFKQLELVSGYRSKLRLKLPTRYANFSGEKVLVHFIYLSKICLQDQDYSTLNSQQREEFDCLFLYLLSTEHQDFMTVLHNSLEIFVDMITDISKSNSDLNLKAETERDVKHLNLLIFHNFDLDLYKDYKRSFDLIYDIQFQRESTSKNDVARDSEPFLTGLTNQINRIIDLIEILKPSPSNM